MADNSANDTSVYKGRVYPISSSVSKIKKTTSRIGVHKPLYNVKPSRRMLDYIMDSPKSGKKHQKQDEKGNSPPPWALDKQEQSTESIPNWVFGNLSPESLAQPNDKKEIISPSPTRILNISESYSQGVQVGGVEQTTQCIEDDIITFPQSTTSPVFDRPVTFTSRRPSIGSSPGIGSVVSPILRSPFPSVTPSKPPRQSLMSSAWSVSDDSPDVDQTPHRTTPTELYLSRLSPTSAIKVMPDTPDTAGFLSALKRLSSPINQPIDDEATNSTVTETATPGSARNYQSNNNGFDYSAGEIATPNDVLKLEEEKTDIVIQELQRDKERLTAEAGDIQKQNELLQQQQEHIALETINKDKELTKLQLLVADTQKDKTKLIDDMEQFQQRQAATVDHLQQQIQDKETAENSILGNLQNMELEKSIQDQELNKMQLLVAETQRKKNQALDDMERIKQKQTAEVVNLQQQLRDKEISENSILGNLHNIELEKNIQDQELNKMQLLVAETQRKKNQALDDMERIKQKQTAEVVNLQQQLRDKEISENSILGNLHNIEAVKNIQDQELNKMQLLVVETQRKKNQLVDDMERIRQQRSAEVDDLQQQLRNKEISEKSILGELQNVESENSNRVEQLNQMQLLVSETQSENNKLVEEINQLKQHKETSDNSMLDDISRLQQEKDRADDECEINLIKMNRQILQSDISKTELLTSLEDSRLEVERIHTEKDELVQNYRQQLFTIQRELKQKELHEAELVQALRQAQLDNDKLKSNNEHAVRQAKHTSTEQLSKKQQEIDRLHSQMSNLDSDRKSYLSNSYDMKEQRKADLNIFKEREQELQQKREDMLAEERRNREAEETLRTERDRRERQRIEEDQNQLLLREQEMMKQRRDDRVELERDFKQREQALISKNKQLEESNRRYYEDIIQSERSRKLDLENRLQSVLEELDNTGRDRKYQSVKSSDLDGREREIASLEIRLKNREKSSEEAERQLLNTQQTLLEREAISSAREATIFQREEAFIKREANLSDLQSELALTKEAFLNKEMILNERERCVSESDMLAADQEAALSQKESQLDEREFLLSEKESSLQIREEKLLQETRLLQDLKQSVTRKQQTVAEDEATREQQFSQRESLIAQQMQSLKTLEQQQQDTHNAEVTARKRSLSAKREEVVRQQAENRDREASLSRKREALKDKATDLERRERDAYAELSVKKSENAKREAAISLQHEQLENINIREASLKIKETTHKEEVAALRQQEKSLRDKALKLNSNTTTKEQELQHKEKKIVDRARKLLKDKENYEREKEILQQKKQQLGMQTDTMKAAEAKIANMQIELTKREEQLKVKVHEDLSTASENDTLLLAELQSDLVDRAKSLNRREENFQFQKNKAANKKRSPQQREQEQLFSTERINRVQLWGKQDVERRQLERLHCEAAEDVARIRIMNSFTHYVKYILGDSSQIHTPRRLNKPSRIAPTPPSVVNNSSKLMFGSVSPDREVFESKIQTPGNSFKREGSLLQSIIKNIDNDDVYSPQSMSPIPMTTVLEDDMDDSLSRYYPADVLSPSPRKPTDALQSDKTDIIPLRDILSQKALQMSLEESPPRDDRLSPRLDEILPINKLVNESLSEISGDEFDNQQELELSASILQKATDTITTNIRESEKHQTDESVDSDVSLIKIVSRVTTEQIKQPDFINDQEPLSIIKEAREEAADLSTDFIQREIQESRHAIREASTSTVPCEPSHYNPTDGRKTRRNSIAPIADVVCVTKTSVRSRSVPIQHPISWTDHVDLRSSTPKSSHHQSSNDVVVTPKHTFASHQTRRRRRVNSYAEGFNQLDTTARHNKLTTLMHARNTFKDQNSFTVKQGYGYEGTEGEQLLNRLRPEAQLPKPTPFMDVEMDVGMEQDVTNYTAVYVPQEGFDPDADKGDQNLIILKGGFRPKPKRTTVSSKKKFGPAVAAGTGAFVEPPEKVLMEKINPKMGMTALRKAVEHERRNPESTSTTIRSRDRSRSGRTHSRSSTGSVGKEKVTLMSIPIVENTNRGDIEEQEGTRRLSMLVSHKDATARYSIRSECSSTTSEKQNKSFRTPDRNNAPWKPPPCKGATPTVTPDTSAFWAKRVAAFAKPVYP